MYVYKLKGWRDSIGFIATDKIFSYLKKVETKSKSDSFMEQFLFAQYMFVPVLPWPHVTATFRLCPKLSSVGMNR